MRRVVTAFTFLIAFGFLGAAQAQTGPPGKICEDTNNLQSLGFPIPISHDTCVAIINANDHNNGAGKVATCKVLQDAGGLEAEGFKNFGDCVSSIQDFGASSLSFAVFGILVAGWAGIRYMRRPGRVISW